MLALEKQLKSLMQLKKVSTKAIQNRIKIPMTQTKTIPHRIEASYGAARVVLRPAAPGSGVIAGASIRAVLELAGIKNILAKQLRSKNKINNAKATVDSLKNLRFLTMTANLRGVPLEYLKGRSNFKSFGEKSINPYNLNKSSSKIQIQKKISKAI